ncbi:spore coat protein [Putridiphycobacter roseus]|uniref:Spore coat protein n=1 Tax=Putridiphycobacter roseus TaxID=2219161 RepID=A0A2W1N2B9_9FLAO|nr:CotH kinase family protein [Putridiphycobacter roseus]PZE18799.1 spore coat protein [Putridiphycobacter roseus]
MKYIAYFSILIFTLNACYKELIIQAGDGLEDWTVTTHSAAALPQYETVFPQDKVNRLDITIAADDWTAMQNDLDDLYGSSTQGGGPGGGGGGGGGTATFTDGNPIYVPCNLKFNDLNWYHVGIRYKGNSSLSAYSSGTKKLPFRLAFDEFNDDYPEITGQTFYGFSSLSMSSNYNDKSFLREKLGCDVFREFGVPAPYSAFYEMYIDYGDGPVYFGLYTAVEVVFETMLDKQFGSETGNCYKPEDDGATFSTSGFNLNDFENKTTGGTGESDIQLIYDYLHPDNRNSDTTSYKTNLASVWDVQGFLKWLAVNTTIQNWDTYGTMSHNYYLYNDPADNLMKWIPWDNNEAFEDGKAGSGALSFGFDELNDNDWPLIGYITNIPGYENDYKNHILDFISTTFETSKMQSYYSELQTLIYSSVEKENSDYSFINNMGEFTTAIETLKNHVETRNTAAENYAN